MVITKEQVEDLKEGDVVEVTWDSGAVLRGPLTAESDGRAGTRLVCGLMTVRHASGHPSYFHNAATLTVIQKAKPPLYSNHPRTEPVRGDVVRLQSLPGDVGKRFTWAYDGEKWRTLHSAGFGGIWTPMPRELVLLVDGETGHVVP